MKVTLVSYSPHGRPHGRPRHACPRSGARLRAATGRQRCGPHRVARGEAGADGRRRRL